MQNSERHFSCYLIGNDNLLIQCADILLSKGYSILGIISSSVKVKSWANDNKISYFQSLSSAKEILLNASFDYLFSIVNDEILDKTVLAAPRKLAINYHDSLLPLYAGVHATSWAILNNEAVHGITWHVIDAGIDTGDILKQSTVVVDKDETAFTLNLKCYQAAINSFSELIIDLSNASYKRKKQDLTERTYFGLHQKPLNTWIVWDSSAEEIDRLCRALDFGQYINKLALPKVIFSKKIFFVKQLNVLDVMSKKKPGTIIKFNKDSIQVATKTYDVLITKIVSEENRCFFELNNKKINSNQLLLSPIFDEIKKFNSCYEDISKAESYLIDEFRNIKDIHFPFLVENLTKAKNKKFILCNEFSFPKKNFWKKHSFLSIILTSFYVYFYKITRETRISAYYRHYNNLENQSILDSLFSNTMPLSLALNDNEDFFYNLKNAHNKITKIDKNSKYLRDIKLRYLLTDSSNLSVMFIVANENLNTFFSDFTESMIISINENKQSLKIFVKSDQINSNLKFMLKQVSSHLLTMWKTIESKPNIPIKEISVLSNNEIKKITIEWNRTKTNYPQYATVHQIFEKQVKKYPNNIAIVCENKKITYRELNNRANQLACYLKNKKLKTNMGIFLSRSVDFIVSILAIIKAGGVYVPLDPSCPDERINYILNDCHIKTILTHKNFYQRVNKFNTVKNIVFLEESNKLVDMHYSVISSMQDANDPIYIMYTSGTTGQPKGIQITHKGVVRLVKNTNYINFKMTDCVAHISNVSFDASTFEIWGALLNGAKLVIFSNEILFSASQLKAHLNKNSINTMLITAALFNQLIGTKPDLFSRLKNLLIGGDTVSISSINKILNKKNKPRRIINAYGPTENSTCSTYYEIKGGAKFTSSIPIGKPVANSVVYVCDENAQLLPIGAAGELYVGGSGVAIGYINKPELTNKKFIPNFFDKKEESKLYKTGDLVRWLPDGNLEFIGRIDNQVKIHGFRIELEEVESIIVQHPNVLNAVVLSQKNGSINEKLIAFAICKNEKNHSLDPQSIRSFLKERLPHYMVPAEIYITDKFPLNVNGKVDRKKLLDNIDICVNSNDSCAFDFENKISYMLLCIWQNFFRNKISIHDNFFELGGDSILAIQIASEANKNGIELSVAQIFQYQTIAELSNHIKTSKKIRNKLNTSISGNVLLTPIQHWFFKQNFNHVEQFSQACLIKIKQEIDSDLLNNYLNELAKCNDAFYLRFIRKGSHWKQYYSKTKMNLLKFLKIDFSNSSIQQLPGLLNDYALEIQQQINLTTGPLFFAANIKTMSGYYLLLVAHHLIFDGISWRHFLHNLESNYLKNTLLDQDKASNGCLKFKEWASAVHSYAKNLLSDDTIKYWKNNCKNVYRLPQDAEKLDNLEKYSHQVEMSLSLQETEQFICFLKKYNLKIDETLIGILVHVLAEWSASENILIDLEKHGREIVNDKIDPSNTVGWFTSLFPMCFKFDKNNSLLKTCLSVRAQMQDINKNGIDYGILKYLSKNNEALDYYSPISFNYWGQLDLIFSRDSIFEFEWLRLISSPNNKRTHHINVEASIAKECLKILWIYNKNYYKKDTINNILLKYIRLIKNLSNTESIEKNILIDKANPVHHYLTPIQKGLLFHAINSLGGEAYAVQFTWELKDSINIEILKRSFSYLIERHAILRTYYEWRGLDEPEQYVKDKITLPWHEYDWSNVSEYDYNLRLEEFLKTDRQANFCLRTPPLLRVALIKNAQKKYTIVMSMHHILLDGWSCSILISELGKIYDTYMNRSVLSLPPVVDFYTYNDWLKNQNLTKAKKKWKSYLSDFYVSTHLPIIQASSSPLIDYAVHTVDISPEISHDISEFCRVHKLTLSSIMQGVWGLILSRYCQSNDVTFGVTVSNRPVNLMNADKILGLLINTIPIRIKTKNNQSVISYFKNIQSNFLELIPHSYVSLADIQSWSDVESKNHLFNTIFVIENYPVDPIKSLEISYNDIQIFDPTHYPIYVAVTFQKTLKIRFSYDKNVVDFVDLKILAAHFESLLINMLNNFNQEICSIKLASEEEYKKIKYDWNKTAYTYQFKAIHELFEIQAKAVPENTAVSFDDSLLTYQELNERSNQMAHYLIKMGAKAGTLIALYLDRSVEMIIGMLAIIKTGAAYLPIDSSYPEARIKYMLEDSKPALFLTQIGLIKNFSQISSTLKIIDIFDKHLFINESKNNLNIQINSSDLIYVIYTSGSTGNPKGVMVKHQSLLNLLYGINREIDITQNDKWLAITPISFDISALEIYLPLIVGAESNIANQQIITDGKKLKAMLDNKRITVMQATPMTWKMLLEVGWANTSQIKILSGGEPLSSQLAKKLRTISPACWNLYGPTETTVWSTFHKICNEGLSHAIYPIGKPIANTEVYVLDENHNINPINIPGELYIAGDGVAKGYLNKLELTKEKFIPNPFDYNKNAYLYKTGDIVRWLPSGSLEYIGRADDQVKIRGFRIELGEIEFYIQKSGLIKQCVVIGYANLTEVTLIAFVIPHDKQHFNAVTFREYLKKYLPLHMIPSFFITLDAFPLTPNKKIDKKSLVNFIEQNKNITYLKKFSDPPINDEEKMLAEIWANVLSIQQNQICRNDNFFEIGGHSLTALQVLSRIYKNFNLDLEVKILIENPTIALLAEKIQSLQSDQCAYIAATNYENNNLKSCLVPLKPTGSKSPLYLVHPVGGTVFWYIPLAKYFDMDRPLYGIQDPGIMSETIPFDSITEMAKHYIDAIRLIQPKGPYIIGGASAGSNVCMEMAHQLNSCNEVVDFIGLLDGWA